MIRDPSVLGPRDGTGRGTRIFESRSRELKGLSPRGQSNPRKALLKEAQAERLRVFPEMISELTFLRQEQ